MKETVYENIKIEVVGKENSVALITLNRPEALNAIDTPLMEDLNVVLDEIEADISLRTVIITGEGRAFSAGGDIKEELKKTLNTGYAYCRKGADLMSKIEHLRVPVIAALNGYTLGGGCELALACDIRVASAKAKLGLPEVTLCLMPGFGGTQRLARLVPVSKAKQLMLSGNMISAKEAYRIGMVDELVEPEELMEKTIALAESMAQWGPLALRAIKTTIVQGMDTSIEKAIHLESALITPLFVSKDAKEALTAFVEKRPHGDFIGE